MNVQGRSLELFFIDGKPDGMLTAEVFNWTGHILVSPRTQIGDALKRSEASFTGIYILIGQQGSTPMAYIGESEDIGARIRNHDTKKDWWETAILITSSANNLHKAHVKYLESRLVEEARAVGRIELENGNTPTRSSLSEAAQTNMESFLDYLLMVLPALRIDMFLKKTRPRANQEISGDQADNPVFELHNSRQGITATAVLDAGEFIVQKGSMARLEWNGDFTDKTSYWRLFHELCEQGIIQPNGKKRIFEENYAFSSTSAAGAVVNGRSTRGPTSWKLKSDGRTYQQWENDQLLVSE